MPWRFEASTRPCDPIVRPSSREIERELQSCADRYQCGISILSVSLTDVRPPTEVEADFAAAQAAESERDRRVNEAKSHDETTATASRATAQAKLETAHATARRTLLGPRPRSRSSSPCRPRPGGRAR